MLTLLEPFFASAMTPAAWVFMLGTWGVVIAITVFCVVRVMRSGGNHDDGEGE